MDQQLDSRGSPLRPTETPGRTGSERNSRSAAAANGGAGAASVPGRSAAP
jgi:hypothetical protein